MSEYMKRFFQDLIKSQLNADQIAARLFRICGSSRYLQIQAYFLMLNICISLDFKRSEEIFLEWRKLMLEEMDTSSNFAKRRISLGTDQDYTIQRKKNSNIRTGIIFSLDNNYITQEESNGVGLDYNLILTKLLKLWFLFSSDKDSWFGFRNRHQSFTSKSKLLRKSQINQWLSVYHKEKLKNQSNDSSSSIFSANNFTDLLLNVADPHSFPDLEGVASIGKSSSIRLDHCCYLHRLEFMAGAPRSPIPCRDEPKMEMEYENSIRPFWIRGKPKSSTTFWERLKINRTNGNNSFYGQRENNFSADENTANLTGEVFSENEDKVPFSISPPEEDFFRDGLIPSYRKKIFSPFKELKEDGLIPSYRKKIFSPFTEDSFPSENYTSAPRVTYEAYMSFLPPNVSPIHATPEQIAEARRQHALALEANILKRINKLSLEEGRKDVTAFKSSVSAIMSDIKDVCRIHKSIPTSESPRKEGREETKSGGEKLEKREDRIGRREIRKEGREETKSGGEKLEKWLTSFSQPVGRDTSIKKKRRISTEEFE